MSIVKGAYVVGRLAGKSAAKAHIAHPSWAVYKAGIVATHAVVTGVKAAVGIAGGLIVGHIFFGE